MALCCLRMIPAIVCIWSWPSTNLFVIAETPIVDLFLLSGNMTEGSSLSLYCNVNLQNLERSKSPVLIEWVRETLNTTVKLARNGRSYDPRYTLQGGSLGKDEQLSIASLRKEDTGSYSCIPYDVNDVPLGSADILILVRYFPATIDCFPEGPTTVQEGATIRMNCTTEIGNPPSTFIIRYEFGISDDWTLSQTADRQTLSLEREIAVTDRGYVCLISQHTGVYAGKDRECFIGPFTVIPATPTTKSLKTMDLFSNVPMTSTPRSLDTTQRYLDGSTTPPLIEHSSSTPYTTSPTPWIAISIISLVLSTVSFVINIFIVVRLQGSHKEAGPATNTLGRVKPYSELQPRCNINTCYTDLMRQSLKEMNESAEYEYPKLDLENSYDDVQVQLAAHRRYQNI